MTSPLYYQLQSSLLSAVSTSFRSFLKKKKFKVCQKSRSGDLGAGLVCYGVSNYGFKMVEGFIWHLHPQEKFFCYHCDKKSLSLDKNASFKRNIAELLNEELSFNRTYHKKGCKNKVHTLLFIVLGWLRRNAKRSAWLGWPQQ